ncbi:MAG TPA: hypothetical protein VGK10_01100 [Prolixibacteraceae bacterium]|jgi:hypothetical protein
MTGIGGEEQGKMNSCLPPPRQMPLPSIAKSIFQGSLPGLLKIIKFKLHFLKYHKTSITTKDTMEADFTFINTSIIMS